MYAIIELGGRQWRVEPGTRLEINRVTTDVGARHTVDRVLLAQDGAGLKIGRPYVDGASVVCEVLEHPRGPKTVSYHFRRRENWRKTVGHRQPLTRLVVKEILFSGSSGPAQAVQGIGEKPAPLRRPAARAATKRPATAAARTTKPATTTRKGTHGA